MEYPSRVEIDLGAVAANVRWIKARVGGAAVMAVVKANAYGHGAPAVAAVALRNGAEMLAVANLAEAQELRAVGIGAPILLMSHLPLSALGDAVDLDLSVSVFDQGFARQCVSRFGGASAGLKVHLKVDTGMGRLGVAPGIAVDLCRQLRESPGIQLEGLYTHFATADDDPAFMREQLRSFRRILARLREGGTVVKYVHAANSAALLTNSESCFNVVRPGIMLYGLEPMPASGAARHLRPAMAWKTRIAQVKTLPPGSSVGYSQAYRTRGAETIAVAPVGYADGLRRAPFTWREVLIRGQRAPLAGRVSMEKITINVSHIPGAGAGDEVVLLGRQGEDCLSADEIAGWIGSNNYEVVCSIAPLAPRVYLNG